MAEPNRIVHLAGSISDGAAIDWSMETSTDPEEQALLRSLRVVDGVSKVLRGRPPEGEPLAATRSAERWGAYEVREEIGAGTYGVVHRAWDPRLAREIALKILKESADRGARDDVERILTEGRRLSRVRHPNVVTIHSVDEFEGRPAIAMELIRGRTLADILREQGPFGAEEVVAIGQALCRALAAVHAAGIVHQDVKAQNVVREQGGRIVLMDFGSGATPLAAAPEVLDGHSPTRASDIYGLGVLLFHLATGTYPVVGSSVEELRRAHAAGRVTRLLDVRPDLASGLVAAIERALAKNPAQRFSTVGEMEAALASSMLTSASMPTIAPPRLNPARRIALGLALLALLLWIVVSKSQRGRPEASPLDTGMASAPAAGGTFEVQGAVFRGAAQRERLVPGSTVALGDSISLSIRTSETIYLYVVDEDDRGNQFLLFPAAGSSPENPLAGGATHLLPGTRRGLPAYWQITSAGGHEHLLLIGSRARLADVEADLLLVDRPEEGTPVERHALSDGTMTHLRGMGGFVTDPSGRSSPVPSLFAAARPLGAGTEAVEGIWIRRIDFESSAP